jgi:hypothetical protein
MSEFCLDDLKVFRCSKLSLLLYLLVKLQHYAVWKAGKIMAQTYIQVPQTWIYFLFVHMSMYVPTIPV